MLVWVLTSDMNVYVKMAVRVCDRMCGGRCERMRLMHGWMGQGPSDYCGHHLMWILVLVQNVGVSGY